MLEKKFNVIRVDNMKYKSLEEAEENAKRFTASSDDAYAVVQAVSVTKVPTPEIEIVKL